MERQIENTLSSFRKPSTQNTLLIPAGAAFACLLIATLAAFWTLSWGIAAVLLLANASFGAAVYLNLAEFRRTRRDKVEVLPWETALPDIQRQNIQLEVRELAHHFGGAEEQLGEMVTVFVVAEDLALRQIQQEYNAPMMRHVSVGRTPFDAVLLKGDLMLCVDVSFLVTPDLRQDKIDAMVKKAATAQAMLSSGGSSRNVRLLIALITQLSPADESVLRSALKKERFSGTPVDIDIRIFDFEALQRIYVMD